MRIASILLGLAHGQPRPAAKPRSLALETLEDRCLLSSGFLQTNLVSDLPNEALFQNKRLVNPWGIAPSEGTGHLRIAENGKGLDSLYVDTGKYLPHWNATVPGPGGVGQGTPTGIVNNDTPNFPVSLNDHKSPATFVTVTEDGTVLGWNNNVDRTANIIVVDNSASGNAVYKGVAIANNGQANYLYVANFHAATVEVYDKNFHSTTLSGSFTDPNLPTGYAPFNILSANGNLYITYALQKADKHDEQDGPGLGLIDVFDPNGNFINRLVSDGGVLNAAWGMAIAPAHGFGPFNGDLLVGNFGDGTINAFNPTSGAFIGTMTDQSGNPISINGLWGLTFGTGEYNDQHTLFFAAGLNDEADGLYGSLNFKAGNAAVIDGSVFGQAQNPAAVVGANSALPQGPAGPSEAALQDLAGALVKQSARGSESTSSALNASDQQNDAAFVDFNAYLIGQGDLDELARALYS